MKHKTKLFFILLSSPLFLFAQTDKMKQQAMVLTCPFEQGSGREPKEAFTWNPPDLKVIMTSKVDSVVRSCTKATVTKIVPGEDNSYEIVINVNDIYFWYHGVIKPLVTKGQVVTAGQALGIYTFGTELEFRMYKLENMQDPRELLECKVPKAE